VRELKVRYKAVIVAVNVYRTGRLRTPLNIGKTYPVKDGRDKDNQKNRKGCGQC
jgi:hypothetical protein